MQNRVAVYGVSLAIAVSLAVAQQGGQTAPGGGGGATGGTTAPSPTAPGPTPTVPGGRPTSPTFPGSQTQQPSTPSQQNPGQEFQRPIFLAGKVLMEDGAPPPDSVVIERVCNGVARPEGYTDSKGRFSFQLGQNRMIFSDASVGNDTGFGGMSGQSGGMGGPMSNGVSERDLWGCEIRASLPGYSSGTLSLTGRRSFDEPNLGTIILRRYGKVEGTTISMTSLQAPKEAQKAFEKGRDAMKKDKWKDASKQFDKAVGLYPQYASAWYESGRALEQQHDLEGARAAYERSVAADSKFVNPYLQLAGLAAQERNWKVVLETTDRAVKLDPFNYPSLYYFNAIAAYNLQDVDAAEKSAREALKLDTQQRYPAVNHILGIILARKGDLTAAAGYLRTYIKLAPTASNVAVAKQQLVDIEKMAKAGR